MSLRTTKILSVLPLLGHPRDSKRIDMLKEAGFAVEVAAFERDYHQGRLPSCPIERLGPLVHGCYRQRVLRLARALPALRRAIRRNDIVYASGTDMAFAATVAGLGLGKPVVIEVGDIRELQVSQGLRGTLVRLLDKHLVNSCSLLVATTPAFVEVYYRQWLKASVPALVVENKLELALAEGAIASGTASCLAEEPLIRRPVRIGYFGVLRCEWSWRTLAAFARARPQQVEIVLAGYPVNPVDLPQQAKKYGNIQYLGQYRSPQDLPALYGQVDLVWGCYQPIGPNDWNLRWARPNRFYESCFFQTPIISRCGSCDATDVSRYDIGLVIKDEDVDDVVKTLSSIRNEDLKVWKQNMAKLPRDVYMYTKEKDELRSAIEGTAKKRGLYAA